MTSPFSGLISPAVDMFALLITVTSGYYMYHQKTTSYQSVRLTLLAVYVIACVLVLFEFFRITIASMSFMDFYTIGSTSFVLLSALLLVVAAVAVNVRPEGKNYRKQATDVLKNHKIHVVGLGAFVSMTAFAGVYLVLFRPYTINQVNNLWGAQVYSTSFSNQYILILLAILVFFLAYPTPLLVLAARKVSNKALKRSLIILAACWAGIGFDFLIFDGYLWTVGIDANDVMYLVFSSVFSVTAVIFRKASTLAGFFETRHESRTGVTESHPFSKQVGVESGYLQGKNFLLEVDPAVSFEKNVKDFAQEFVSMKDFVFVFTSKGSPIYKALAQIPDVKFFITTTDVSYPKPTDNQSEVLVPKNDYPVLLDLLSKTIKSTLGSGIALVFDSASDMILSSGYENCYKFIRQANEIMSEPRVTSLFLMTLGAHDEKVVRLIKSLFSNHLIAGPSGLKITRQIEA